MAPKIVDEAQELWESWNIRICIVVSFLIQLCLTLIAPLRKRHYKMSSVIWVFYLLADAIALYTIGLISNSSLNTSTNHILVFWSPFLLVHLGGPDTITALALEDNELWLRHFLQLATQSAGTFYLFYRAIRTKSGIELLIPALIMYANGCVKYLERTASLYLASIDTYRESLSGKPYAGPNYAALMEEFSSRKTCNIPVYIHSDWEAGQSSSSTDSSSRGNGNNNNNNNKLDTGDSSVLWTTKVMNLVKQAYHFYLKFRGLITERMFSSIERTESLEYFLKIEDGKQAFKVIQIELNFIYDVFYTKTNTLLKTRGSTRVITFITIIAAYLLFYLNKHTHNYRMLDVCITHVLLVGGIFMELLAFVMFCFSDWAVVGVAESAERWKCKAPFFNCILDFWLRHRPRRWSQQISQYDLLYCCLNDHSTLMQIMSLIKRLRDVVVNAMYTATYVFDDELGNEIFKELQIKAEIADTPEYAKKACEARGNLVFFSQFAEYSSRLSDWTLKVDYDESLLLWHLATNLCFQVRPKNGTNDEGDAKSSKHRKYSKMLGDYMMYLLIMKPSMTSSVAGIAQVRFQDTCEEAKMFIRRKLRGDKSGKLDKVKQFFVLLGKFFSWLLCGVWNMVYDCCCCGCIKKITDHDDLSLLCDSDLKDLCRKILGVDTVQKPEKVKGDRSKSVMFDACRLAKELHEIGKTNEEKQWEVIFKVWVELLCYSACRSKPTAHVAQLREGGELITLVWLLMAHLGLGEQFRINKGTGWAKLIVPK